MKSLRTRLLLAYAGLILLGFTVLALLAGRQIAAGTVQDFANSLAEQAQLVARALKEPVEEGFEHGFDEAAIHALLQTYAEQAGAVVVLVGRDGRLWDSSSGTISDTDTPEVQAALSGSLSSDTRDNTAYAAAPVLEDGRVMAVVQLAAPLSDAQRLVVERWGALTGAVLAVTAVAGLAAIWLSITLTRPLAQLQQAALQIAQGNFTQRLTETRQDELGEVARAFNHMSAQVEAMIEEQRAFASNASHELRTPLTTIRLRSEALRDGFLDEATAQQYVAEIDDEVQRLGNLVQDLMMLSRLDSGRLQIGHEQIDITRLARQLLAEITLQAESRAITLKLDASSALPTVTAAQAHLMLVFRNLLSNALKYTPDGGQITWHIEATAHALQHTICDTGQGIAADDLPHVFDRFYRVDKSRSRAVPGVGLGLALVRMVVEFYGGSVYLHSPGMGQGTTAHVTWPLAPANSVL
ncbi:MAG: HAMP domain-containing protein [Ardenticatenaceae bacterium]|nr:HAMP domain-containing protein [Ardenticatenaceae bacterium]